MSNPNVIVHLDVNDPVGQKHPGGMVILSGDAPVWKYCNLFHQCVTEGAGVVAIAHGIDTKTNSDASVVAYSTSAGYQIGQMIGHCRVPRTMTIELINKDIVASQLLAIPQKLRMAVETKAVREASKVIASQ